MNKMITLLMIAFLPGIVAMAQTEEATTRSGKKVVLYADGTWKYADAATSKTEPVKEPLKEKKKTITPVGVSGLTADCDELAEVNEDSRTGLRITKSRSMMIASGNGKGEIGIFVQKTSKGIMTLLLYPVGAGNCIGEGNKVIVEFTDGSKIEMVHDAFANCSGEFSTGFGGNFGKKKQLDQLKTKKIRSVKVWTQNGSVQQPVPVDAQDTLLKLFNCLGS